MERVKRRQRDRQPPSPQIPGSRLKGPPGGAGLPRGAGGRGRAARGGALCSGPRALARQRSEESGPRSARRLRCPPLSKTAAQNRCPSPAPDGEGPRLLPALSVVSPPRPRPQEKCALDAPDPPPDSLGRGAGALKGLPALGGHPQCLCRAREGGINRQGLRGRDPGSRL